jgi:hypothetical protein
MIRVSPPIETLPPDPQSISISLLAIIDANRTRTRTLGTMVLTVCGMLLSATFVIIFFILNSHSASNHLRALILFFISASMLMVAIFASLISATLTPPVSVRRQGKGQAVAGDCCGEGSGPPGSHGPGRRLRVRQ